MSARPFIAALLLALALSCGALAADEKEMIFREDSGLTKTEYLLSVGKYAAALNEADNVLLRHPANADAYTYKGYAYDRLGQKKEAEQNFKRALQIDPAHLGANKYLADLYLDEGDVARAIEQLQVIRMTCGRTDCEELHALERDIDSHKPGGGTKTPSKKEAP